MSSERVLIGLGVMYGPLDDLLDREGAGEEMGSKEDAIALAQEEVRRILEERIPEDMICRVYLTENEEVYDNDYGEPEY